MRKILGLGYVIFDLLGSIAFCLLKILGLIPKNIGFDKDIVKKILIIRKDRIGDIILSTPTFRAVRQSYPKAKIHLLVQEYTKDLVVNNKNIDKILIWGEDEIENDYDLAIALHPGIIENELTFKSGARFRIGFSGRGGSFFLTHRVNDDRAKRIRHEVISALEIVEIAGCSTVDKTLEVSITEQGEAFVSEFFKQHEVSVDDFVVMIHPGARQEYIRWKKQGFAQVADMLKREKKAKVILLEGKDESKLIEDITSLMSEDALTVSGISLTELVSLIKRMKLFVGNSTGPMHIAAALNVPVVAIFGSRHPLDSLEEWGPWGEENCGIQAVVDCRKCHPSDCRNGFKCMSKVEAKEVFKAINILLSKQDDNQ